MAFFSEVVRKVSLSDDGGPHYHHKSCAALVEHSEAAELRGQALII